MLSLPAAGQKNNAGTGDPFALSGSLPSPTAAGTGGANLLLPDLIAWADQGLGYMYDWYVDTNEIPGRTLLRLSTAAPNIGSGPMELRGGTVNPDDTQDVDQRIYDNQGGYTNRFAGVFIHHESHGHIHFESFAQLNLREVIGSNGVGAVTAQGEKVSFCLLDVKAYDLGLPGAPFIRQYQTCEQIQGISVGWADVYDASLPDQWIDITGVPDDQYWVEVIIDPDDNMLEENETNNVERILIDLETGCATDTFETNNSFTTASALGQLGDRAEYGLSVCDQDYYELTACANGTLNVDIMFRHAPGNMDLRVYDGSQAQLAISQSSSDDESVSVPVTAGQTYYIHVYGFQGATNLDYDLVIDGPNGTTTSSTTTSSSSTTTSSTTTTTTSSSTTSTSSTSTTSTTISPPVIVYIDTGVTLSAVHASTGTIMPMYTTNLETIPVEWIQISAFSNSLAGGTNVIAFDPPDTNAALVIYKLFRTIE